MRLRRLAVRHFRKLQAPVLLEPIADGLTIVSGDNEEGKSTVLAALKSALFEHHAVGGAVREAMAPAGTSLVPEIEVDFVVRGQNWRLRKAFRRGGAELDVDGQRLSGDAAEDRLVDLLRFQRRHGRSELRAEHQGLTALFWVDQGTSFNGYASLALGRDRIATAVAGELEALTGGAETGRLLAAVRQRCDQYWTPTFKERGRLKEAGEQQVALAAEVEALRSRVVEAADKEERLARLRDPRRQAADAELAAQAALRRDEARQRLEGIAAVERQWLLAAERLKAGRAVLAQAEAAAMERLRRREALAGDETAWRQAEAHLTERHLALAAAAERRDEAEAAETQARAAAAVQERAVEHCRYRLQAVDRRRERQRLEAALAKVHEAAADAARLQQRLTADHATTARLAVVRDAQREHDRAAAALAAAATTIELQPEVGRTARLQGAADELPAALELTERTTLNLAGWGKLVVVPGGTDIATRRATFATATARLTEALRAMGAAGLDDAERRCIARSTAEHELKAVRDRLAAVIEGTGCPTADELTSRVATLRTDEPVDELDASDDPAAMTTALAAARERLTALRAAAGHALTVLRQREIQAAQAREHAVLAEREVQRLQAAIAAARSELADAGAAHSDAALREAVETARNALLALEGEAARLERELKLADGEAVRMRLDMAEREIDQLTGERTRREHQIVELESELRAVGEDGLGERLAEHESCLAQATAELRRLRHEAMAWKMAYEALERALRADREALLAPVVDRLQPWLRRLFADAVPVLDAHSLTPAAVQRGGLAEPIESLSLGTREQIAILVRLGVASLLAEQEGEAPSLILDDALVYADQARFEIMKTILQRAARELQIIVLTCRPKDYFGLDACYMRLEDCRRP